MEGSYTAEFSVYDLEWRISWLRFDTAQINYWEDTTEIINEKYSEGFCYQLNRVMSNTEFNERGQPLTAYCKQEWEELEKERLRDVG